jgi:hypothetical protein
LRRKGNCHEKVLPSTTISFKSNDGMKVKGIIGLEVVKMGY